MTKNPSADVENRQYLDQVVSFLNENKPEEAEAVLNRLVAKDGNNPQVYFWRGKFYEMAGAVDSAIGDYTQAIKLSPQNSWLYFQRALVYEEIGFVADAQTDYDRIIELEPKDPYVYLLRGKFHSRWRNYESALPDAETAISLAPDDYAGYFYKAIFLIEATQYQEAEKIFGTLLSGSFDFPNDYFTSIVKFYAHWSRGLFLYYNEDNINRAQEEFVLSQRFIQELPGEAFNTDMLYVRKLLEGYLQIIPLDAKLKDVLKTGDEVWQNPRLLEGLAEQFSGMAKTNSDFPQEAVVLLETKRDICRLLLPPGNYLAIKPEDAPAVVNRIGNILESLGYANATELVRILQENRQRQERQEPFTAELPKMGAMADGILTFKTTQRLTSEKFANLVEIPERKETSIEYQDAQGRTIRETLVSRLVPSEGEKSVTQKPKDGFTSPVNIPENTEWHQVRIQKADDYCLVSCKGQKPQRLHYAQLTFLDKRKGNKPDMLWDVLNGFAKGYGEYRPFRKRGFLKTGRAFGADEGLDYDDLADNETGRMTVTGGQKGLSLEAIARFKVNLTRLRDKLKSLFPSIPGDPFHPYRGSYKTRFQIEPLISDQEIETADLSCT